MKKLLLCCLAIGLLLAFSLSTLASEVAEDMPVVISGPCVFPGCEGTLYQFRKQFFPGLYNTRVCEHGNITFTDSQYQTKTVTYDRCNRCGIQTNMTEAKTLTWKCNAFKQWRK